MVEISFYRNNLLWYKKASIIDKALDFFMRRNSYLLPFFPIRLSLFIPLSLLFSFYLFSFGKSHVFLFRDSEDYGVSNKSFQNYILLRIVGNIFLLIILCLNSWGFSSEKSWRIPGLEPCTATPENLVLSRSTPSLYLSLSLLSHSLLLLAPLSMIVIVSLQCRND